MYIRRPTYILSQSLRYLVKVGEEYLLLLPECLPFLSEMMEDDAEEVSALAGDVVQFVEELSGEKLDAYLQ
jgi:U3 small nucleolar RNA-associated protein 10